MSKIRYLSDGALRYIKGRLDSIEKKINNGGNITTPKDCKILSITSNILTTYNNEDGITKVIYMTTDDNYINGNMNILVDSQVYNINIYIKNSFIYTAKGDIGAINYIEKDINSQMNIIISTIINNRRINISETYPISFIKDIDINSGISASYIVNAHESRDIYNSTFDDMCNAKTINIDGLYYVISDIDVTNKVINLKCISAPLNNYNFEVQVQFVNNTVRLKSINSNYIDVRP